MTKADGISSPNDKGEDQESPSLEELEALVERLGSYKLVSEFAGRDLLSGKDADQVEASLLLLKVGAARVELPQEVQEQWEQFGNRWASENTLNEFAESLIPFVQALHDRGSQVLRTEKEMETLNERILTLQAMADLLDELSAASSRLPTTD